MVTSKKIFIYLTPNARQDKIGETVERENKTYLKVYVKAAPREGEANEALIVFLSKIWAIPKSHIRLINGAQSRYKTLLVQDLNNKISLPSQQTILPL